MARPAIDRLFDHTCRIWRSTSTKDDLGAESRTYAPIAEAQCALKRPTAPLADLGAGLAPTGRRRFYMRPDQDIQLRDVVEILSGPDAGGAQRTWEVDEPPTIPRGHHTQVDAFAWQGILPPIEES